MSSGSSENREKLRTEVCLTARLEGTAADVRVSDLSEGGCYVDSIAEMCVGEKLRLKILTGKHWFEMQGVVAHHFPRLGFGVRFVDLSDKQRAWIRSVIDPPPRQADESNITYDAANFWLSSNQIALTNRRIM